MPERQTLKQTLSSVAVFVIGAVDWLSKLAGLNADLPGFAARFSPMYELIRWGLVAAIIGCIWGIPWYRARHQKQRSKIWLGDDEGGVPVLHRKKAKAIPFTWSTIALAVVLLATLATSILLLVTVVNRGRGRMPTRLERFGEAFTEVISLNRSYMTETVERIANGEFTREEADFQWKKIDALADKMTDITFPGLISSYIGDEERQRYLKEVAIAREPDSSDSLSVMEVAADSMLATLMREAEKLEQKELEGIEKEREAARIELEKLEALRKSMKLTQ